MLGQDSDEHSEDVSQHSRPSLLAHDETISPALSRAYNGRNLVEASDTRPPLPASIQSEDDSFFPPMSDIMDEQTPITCPLLDVRGGDAYFSPPRPICSVGILLPDQIPATSAAVVSAPKSDGGNNDGAVVKIGGNLRDFSDAHSDGLLGAGALDIIDDLLRAPSILSGAPTQEDRPPHQHISLEEAVNAICVVVAEEFPRASSDVLPALYIVKYMVKNARNISPGNMHVSNFIRIFWCIHRQDCRCHLWNFYHYSRGAWAVSDEKMFGNNFPHARPRYLRVILSRSPARRRSTSGNQ